MKKKNLFLALLLLISFTGVTGKTKSNTQIQEQKIASLLKKMTLKEKVGMLHANSKFYVNGVKRLGIPELALSDGPHGVRAEMNLHDWNYAGWTNDSATCFPPGTALAASWNRSLAYQRGIVLGEEARFRKKDVLLGPGVNIIRSPLCGRNFEYLSEDPFLVAEMAVPYIQGLQSKDVSASVKHFLANNQEDHRTSIDVSVSERALHEIYLPAFKAAVMQGGSHTVMVAYNKFRGDWCSENEYLDREILRNELGFKGILMTDWGATHSTVKAALAGLDLEMGTEKKDYNDWYFAQPLIQAVKEGKVPMAVVDEKVANILRVMLETNMLDERLREKGKMNTPEHQKAAYQSAVEAAVLLKNQNHLLPIDFSRLKSVAIIGDNATRKHCSGGLSSEIKTIYEVTPLEAMQKKFGSKLKINFAQGYEKQSVFHDGNNSGQSNTNTVDWKLIDEAVKVASESEVAILFCGLNHDFDTESFDRQNMKLPYGQETLIQEVAKVNPRTVVVMIAGSPVELAGIANRVPALLWTWYGGMEAGNAAADLLSGTVNPSGKLPFTLPVSLEQSPAHALGNFPGKDGKVNYEEDILVGYRWFDTKKITPQYPFGFGLSYTTFELSAMTADQKVYQPKDLIRVKFNLKNSGSAYGAEVVQLYVGHPGSSVLRSAKELKGFDKTFLQPGETRNIEISLKASDLAYYNEAAKGWTLEPGEYLLQLGTSSAEIRQTVRIVVN